MDFAASLRHARSRSGLSQRELAEQARTSQAAVSAYESAGKLPSVPTAQRLLAATGCTLAVADAPGRRTTADLRRSGERLADVLALAEALPFRRPGPLRFPRLPVHDAR